MNEKHAQQIADLLNDRNKLVGDYDANRVLRLTENYEYILDKNDNIIAAVEIKRVQWYQWEICHLSVSKSYEGKRYGTKLVKESEQKAKKGRARIIQCTIRENNEPSKGLFSKNGYKQVSTFCYPDSGNDVGVWQKVVSPPR